MISQNTARKITHGVLTTDRHPLPAGSVVNVMWVRSVRYVHEKLGGRLRHEFVAFSWALHIKVDATDEHLKFPD